MITSNLKKEWGVIASRGYARALIDRAEIIVNGARQTRGTTDGNCRSTRYKTDDYYKRSEFFRAEHAGRRHQSFRFHT